MNTDPLQKPRQEIDAIDQQIVSLLSKRWQVVEEVSAIKLKYDLPKLQASRFDEMLEELKSLKTAHSLPEGMIEELWHVIHKYSLLSQDNIR